MKNSNEFTVTKYKEDCTALFFRIVSFTDKLFPKIANYKVYDLHAPPMFVGLMKDAGWINTINYYDVSKYVDKFSNAEYLALLTPKIRAYKLKKILEKEHVVVNI